MQCCIDLREVLPNSLQAKNAISELIHNGDLDSILHRARSSKTKIRFFAYLVDHSSKRLCINQVFCGSETSLRDTKRLLSPYQIIAPP